MRYLRLVNDISWICQACDKEYDWFSEQEYGIIKYYLANKPICGDCYEQHCVEMDELIKRMNK